MSRTGWRWLLLLVFSAWLTAPAAHAHVGSKDIYEDADAGPYKLFVTIRPPVAIPGTATVEVRSVGAPVSNMTVTPMPMTGEGSRYAPQAETLKRSAVDKHFYTGSFWLMEPGSWRLRLAIAGPSGAQATAVPVPAMALSIATMPRSTGILLIILGAFLLLSLAAIVIAAVRESRLKPGFIPGAGVWRRALLSGATGLLCAFCILLVGDRWWKASAAGSLQNVYRPIVFHPALHGDQLDLRMQIPGATTGRSLSDFIPDHGHLMHLYVIREPQMDVIYHLHPDQVAAGDFHLALPAMPPGSYALYGDVVHASGFPETLVARVEVPPGLAGRPLAGDDASGTARPLAAGMLNTSFRFPDGYTMVWDRPASLSANTGYQFRFRLLDASGRPPSDMRYYMGMVGHAAFIKTDGTAFAHVHPEGSASMAALMLANQAGPGEAAPANAAMTTGPMSAMAGMPAEPISNVVAFPYGFPSPGRYRIFIQMKHGGTVETGAFDAQIQ